MDVTCTTLPEIITPALNVMATVCVWVLSPFPRQNFSHKNPIDSDIGSLISGDVMQPCPSTP